MVTETTPENPPVNPEITSVITKITTNENISVIPGTELPAADEENNTVLGETWVDPSRPTEADVLQEEINRVALNVYRGKKHFTQPEKNFMVQYAKEIGSATDKLVEQEPKGEPHPIHHQPAPTFIPEGPAEPVTPEEEITAQLPETETEEVPAAASKPPATSTKFTFNPWAIATILLAIAFLVAFLMWINRTKE